MDNLEIEIAEKIYNHLKNRERNEDYFIDDLEKAIRSSIQFDNHLNKFESFEEIYEELQLLGLVELKRSNLGRNHLLYIRLDKKVNSVSVIERINYLKEKEREKVERNSLEIINLKSQIHHNRYGWVIGIVSSAVGAFVGALIQKFFELF
jgi:hypothetical protein